MVKNINKDNDYWAFGGSKHWKKKQFSKFNRRQGRKIIKMELSW